MGPRKKFVSQSPSAGMDFGCSDVSVWKDAVGSYNTRIRSMGKPDLIGLDDFYRTELPLLLRKRDPSPYITQPELYKLMQWKLARGKWRPRLLDFISSLDGTQVESTSHKAFQSLPSVREAVIELSTLKGVGPATASAVLAAYAPDIAPFMSDEAMVAALGSSKDYSLKQYLIFAEKLQTKAKQELSVGGDLLTPSDVEMALWSSAMGGKSASSSDGNPKAKRKREP
ncbi:uncharacterized protein LOC131218841 isoform X2 [Magnolia sinica]|uniref:uncharacterized protein LOC131218841 isoform X2 n=1 Tax=Magnolia sinica TaxID=86752 RepID=UPI002659DEC8|nr:uncharacterized protein LOC131218841 isoform X2 [Magnolia sinica]